MRPPSRPRIASPSPQTKVVSVLHQARTPRQPGAVGTAARFAERERQRKRILRDRVLTWSAVGLVLAVVGWVLLFSPVLALHADQIEVVVVGDATVVDTAQVGAVLSVADGTPLPRLDTVSLRRSVLEVPGVRAASVNRAFPHAVVVTVVAREPVAAVPDGDGVVLVDAEAVQVGRADAAPPGLPVLDVSVDQPRALAAVLTVLDELPQALAEQVTAAGAGSPDSVFLELSDGTRVEWGSAEENALKAEVLVTLRASGPAGVQVYDVSAPTLPITRS